MINILIFLLLAALVGYLIMKFVWKVVKFLAANAIVGLILLWLLNHMGISSVEFNLINILIVAVGGIVGVFILVLLSWI
ncbi:pro-sigmaK processing inhibitor BofA family protein [Thermococcus sp.]